MHRFAPRIITRITPVRWLATMLAAAGLAFAAQAQAADYPTKPVRVVVAFTAGGTTDMLARSVSQQLAQRFRVNADVVVVLHGQRHAVRSRALGAFAQTAHRPVPHARERNTRRLVRREDAHDPRSQFLSEPG